MILYFSGTGNSRHAALRIAGIVGDEALDLFERIRTGDAAPLSSDRPWVLVTPTYAWRVPRVVEKLLRRTELRGNRDLYFALTCGDGAGDAARYAARLCADMGMNFRGCAAVVMPENYIALFDAPDEARAREIVRAADARIDALGARIAAGVPLPETKSGALGKFLSGPVNPIFYRFIVKDKKFRASDACTACGLCARRCPMGNIRLTGGKPIWSGKCTHCMACICDCPQSAIEYGRASVGKPRYRCPKE